MDTFRLYLFIAGMRRFSFNAAFTIFAVYLVRDVGVNPFELAIPGAAYEIATFFFEIPTGVVADVYSRRLSVIIGYFMLGAGLAVAGIIPALWVATLGLAIAGVGSTFVSGALSAWIVDEIGQERASQGFVRASQISQIFGLLGILVSVALGSISLNLPTIIAGLGLVMTSLILIPIMPETGFQAKPKSEREGWRDMFTTFGAGMKSIRARPILMWMMVIVLIYAGYGEAFGKFWQAHILEYFTLPEIGNLDDIVWFGIISTVFMPITLFASELVRRRVNLSDNDAVKRTMTLLFMGTIASTLLFALSEIFMLMLLGVWLTQMFIIMIGPLMEAWLNLHAQSDVRATVLSIKGQINAFGEIIGGPAAGGVATVASLRIALSLTALSLLPLIPVFNRTAERPIQST